MVSDTCQCPYPDIVVESEKIWCAICGGDVPFPEAALSLYCQEDDVADAKNCAKFETNL